MLYDQHAIDKVRLVTQAAKVLFRQAPAPAGFAVVDVETTGLYPRTDRVVEVAVVHVSAEGQITAEFSTLINPGRDVGPTRIHGIRAQDILHAPSFSQAAAALWQMLDGRVLVAHNVPFDVRFLDAEFGRCGVSLPPPPLMCTMHRQLLSAGPARAQSGRVLRRREHQPVAVAQRP